MTLQEYRDTPYAWPGGYTILALMADGECLCHKCACDSSNPVHEDETMRDGWLFEGGIIHWEGAPLHCAHCDAVLESEYGDPMEEGNA